jgi:fucose 4-O-acetylase-like acetyltransferase
MRSAAIAVAGALCGIGWWAVSWLLGAKAYGIWGAHPAAGLLAGVVTGVVVAVISEPVYRHRSARSLYWYSPLSVYVAVAIYGLVIFVFRNAIDDFDSNQIRWAVGVQSVLGMWWGITLILPCAVAVQVLAYLNHRALRKISAWPIGTRRASGAGGSEGERWAD